MDTKIFYDLIKDWRWLWKNNVNPNAVVSIFDLGKVCSEVIMSGCKNSTKIVGNLIRAYLNK